MEGTPYFMSMDFDVLIGGAAGKDAAFLAARVA
jgi:hypothetical protein